MGNTLIDEPVPPTLSEPPVGDRPTLDDVPPGERRGPSPTLPDGPPLGGLRGASPTLPDVPPYPLPGPSAGTLYAAPAAPAPPAAPAAPGMAPAAPQALPPLAPAVRAEPIILPASPAAAAPAPAAAVPAPAAATPAAPVAAPAAPQTPPPPPIAPAPQAAPLVGAPPPLAYPVAAAPAPGLLAQLPAMPAMRPMPAQLSPATPPPATAAPQTPAPEPSAAPAAAAAEPPDDDSSREALPPVAPGAAPAAAPARLAPGARTLVGVAPPPATAAVVPESTNKYSPPGQTSAPNPLAMTQPVMQSVREGVLEAPAPADDEAQEEPAAAPKSAPRGKARRWVAAVFAVLGVLAIAGVVTGYFLFFRYTPHAERHIPGASNLAVRADVRAIGTFAPVRKHLWPALFERPAPKSAGKTLTDRVAEATGINPSIDVREAIVASVDSKSWVLLVGGNFKPGRFVSGMEKVLRDEGYLDWHKSGELLLGPGGIAMGQADDGTLVIGTEAEIVTAALPASEEFRRMDLPKSGALSFAVSKEAWEELSRSTGAFDPSGALRRIRHMRGTLELGDEPRIDLDIEPKGGENAETLAQDVDAFLGKLRLALVLLPDQMGEKTALSAVKVAVENNHVRARGPWPLEGLDRGCAKLVGLLGLTSPQ